MSLPVVGSVVKLNSRMDGFFTSHGGCRWVVKNPTPGTGILGLTSLVRTTPLVSIYQTAGTAPLTLSTLTLSQVGTVAGGAITLLICASATNLYSSGGTLITAKNTNPASSTTAGFIARSLPTVTTTATADDVWEATIPNVTGTALTINLLDVPRIGTTGSLHLFAFAATTAPTLTFGIEVIQGQDEI